jgi:hypothetical protein
MTVLILSDQMTKQRMHTYLTIIGIVATLAVLMTGTIVTPSFAIKNFFNCMTDNANRHGKLTLDDVHMCLHKQYHAYRNLPYDIHSHSFRGATSTYSPHHTHLH